MGFGILLIGYLFSYILRIGLGKYAFAGMLVGFFISYLALTKLRKYCPSFIYAQAVNVILIFASFYKSAEGIDRLFYLDLGIADSVFSNIFQWLLFALDLIFNILLLYSIADMANRVELDDVKAKAFRNMIFVGLYNAFQLFLFFPVEAVSGYASFLMTLLTILALVYTLLNAVLIFRCYAFICPEGDEKMERKPSRFAFINRINAERDAKEQKAIDETNKYYAEKAKQKLEKRKKKNQSSKNTHKKKK